MSKIICHNCGKKTTQYNKYIIFNEGPLELCLECGDMVEKCYDEKNWRNLSKEDGDNRPLAGPFRQF